ncbi:MAG: SRPBCC family protein, partial [Acidimicrobiales bacterium]
MAPSPYVFDYRGRFTLAAPPTAVWGSIERGDRFESWWAWLREFRIDGGRLEDGAVLHGVVSPPVPYEMRIRVVLEHCLAPHRIDATVHGDLEGPATLLLEPRGDGTEAVVAWTIEMKQRPMR